MGKGDWEDWLLAGDARRRLGRLGQEDCAGEAGRCAYVWTPAADVLETPQALVVQVELPGIEAGQVVVEIVDGDLLVRGERPCARPPAQDATPEPVYHQLERAYGTFARRFPLPPGLDGGCATARLEAGLLIISLPKSCPKAPARFRLRVG